eukprot:1901835-Alexandrium_andersonii.AAC.1
MPLEGLEWPGWAHHERSRGGSRVFDCLRRVSRVLRGLGGSRGLSRGLEGLRRVSRAPKGLEGHTERYPKGLEGSRRVSK